MGNNKFKKVYLSLCLLMASTFVFSQQEIKGKVLDDRTGDPLIGVTVTIQGTNSGTITDFNGDFQLKVSEPVVLQFRYVGYVQHDERVSPQSSILNVRMREDARELDEVLIVGYGTQAKASSVASIVQTKGEDLLKVGNLNSLSESLQGKLNGVITINNNAKPGANTADIYIRGKATWGDTSPLTLVDGIERNFNDIDVNEIETISVLKDASATAVYGVKGANGVILITTRRGENLKPTVRFSSNLGLKQFTTNVKFADYLTSIDAYNRAASNEKDWSKQIPQSTVDAWKNAYATGNYGPYNDVFPEIDWFKELVRDFGFSQNYNINVSGGDSFVSYFVSVGYQEDGDNYKIQKQEDFDPRYWYRRYNWRSNLDFNLTKTTKFSVKIAGKMGYQNEPTGSNEVRELFTPILHVATNLFPVKYSDGSWGEGKQLGYNIVANVSTRGQELNKSFQGWYDFSLLQKLDFITKGLSAKGKLAYNSYANTNTRIRAGQIFGANAFESQSYSIFRVNREYDYSKPTVNSDGSISYPMINEIIHPNADAVGGYPVGVTYDSFDGYGRQLYYELSLDYKRTFGNHNLTALALFNRRINDSAGSGGSFSFPSYSEDWVGRVTYNYLERYLTEVNMAYTGSEKFAPGKRFGFFPSFSAGWRISEEPIIKNLAGSTLSNMKLRFSYGEVGNDKGSGRFNYVQLFDTNGTINYGYVQNMQFGPLYSEGAIANPNSTWETAKKRNLGFELGLWHQLDLNVELFDEHRTGMLMTRNTVPFWMGISSLPAVNMGETKNHGLEISIDWKRKINNNFSYNLGIDFTTSENRVIFRDDPFDLDEHLKAAGKPIGTQSRFIAVGNYNTIDDIFNYAQTAISGIAPNQVIPGDLAYIDYNGDGIINANDNVVVEQINYPLTTLSIRGGFRYKNWNLSLLIYTPRGVYKNLPVQYLWDFPMSNIKAQPNVNESWTPDKATNEGVIRPGVRLNNAQNDVASTYRYRDYSYVRLKNVELNYSVPKRLLKQISIDNLQWYVNGNNIVTFSNLDKRIDPETGGDGSYPIVRTYTTGLRVTF